MGTGEMDDICALTFPLSSTISSSSNSPNQLKMEMALVRRMDGLSLIKDDMVCKLFTFPFFSYI